MIVRLWMAVAAVSLLTGECISVPEKRYGRVQVIVTDETGQRLERARVELLTEERRSVNLAESQTFPSVAYGRYRLRVSAAGFGSASREVLVLQPEIVTRVQLEVGGIGCAPEPRSIGGRISRSGQAGELWVKAIPVQGAGGFETRVSDNGFFLISGLDTGAYLLVVMQGERAVHMETVRMPGHPATPLRLTIRLP